MKVWAHNAQTVNVICIITLDYTENLVFEECDELDRCLVLSIIDDDRVEEDERLSIILKNTRERENVLLRNGTLTVIDDDGMLTCSTSYKSRLGLTSRDLELLC